MKRILITGKDSYIGRSFEGYIKEYYPDGYSIDSVDMRDDGWKSTDMSVYDAVFHVAGLAHNNTSRPSRKQTELYYKINRDLAIEAAKKAKADGAKQFIFMSSIAVYGKSSSIGKSRVITKETEPSPNNIYSDSKFMAECEILPLSDEDFKVVILRSPMVYGKRSKGNYITLSKFAKKLPFFRRLKMRAPCSMSKTLRNLCVL